MTDFDFTKKHTSAIHTFCDPIFSPVRIIFHNDDPAKDRTLDLVTEIQKRTATELGNDPTVKLRTTWADAYKLIVRGSNVGISPFFDPTGAAVISGYQLLTAGLLTNVGSVSVDLTATELRSGRLSDSPTVEEVRDAVMSMYLDALSRHVIETKDTGLAELYTQLAEAWPLQGSNPAPERPARFYQVLLAEGRPEDIQSFRRYVHDQFQCVSEEPDDESGRHRAWFNDELGAFSPPHLEENVTIAFRFDTEPGSSMTLPPIFPIIADVMDEWKQKCHLAWAGIDTTNAPGALAVGLATDVGKAFVGSIDEDHDMYFGVMQHLL